MAGGQKRVSNPAKLKYVDLAWEIGGSGRQVVVVANKEKEGWPFGKRSSEGGAEKRELNLRCPTIVPC